MHNIPQGNARKSLGLPLRRAAQAGVNFAFLKATEGGDRVDAMFAENHAAARRAGVPVGAYHFYYFCTPPEVQARWFLDTVPREAGALPPVLDLEWNPFSPTCTFRPPAEEVRAVVRRWIEIVSAAWGHRPILYVPPDFWETNDIGRIDEEYWLRTVAAHPSERFPGVRWSFWQYSGTGIVPGVAGDCDLNCFAGTVDGWRRWRAARTV